MGLRFEVRASAVGEAQLRGESPESLAGRLSRLKAEDVAAGAPGCWVVGADTVVAFQDRVLGKPADPEDAVRMLRTLRGRRHRVCSGITLIPPGRPPVTEVVCTDVEMRPYTDAEIESYVATGDPLDKAGAYAIQHAGFSPVGRIDGCYANVMGLPMCRLARVLRQSGYALDTDVRDACVRATGYRRPHDAEPRRSAGRTR
jgi:septum formation protein